MRIVQYGVAVSLDGYIAGPNGEVDWIMLDPEIDFSEIWGQFDTLLMGRKTFEAAIERMGRAAFADKAVFVASRSLKSQDCPGVTLVSELTRLWMQSLKSQGGKNIWLMGGGEVFRYLLNLGEIDSMSVMIVPVLLGAGIPLLPGPYSPTTLQLTAHRVYKSGLFSATFDLNRMGG